LHRGRFYKRTDEKAAFLNEQGGQHGDAGQKGGNRARHLKVDNRQPMPKNMDALQRDL
jgi:hypothetical protein